MYLNLSRVPRFAIRPPVPRPRAYFQIAGIAGATITNGEVFGLVLAESLSAYIIYMVEFRSDGGPWTPQTPPSYALHVAFTAGDSESVVASSIYAVLPFVDFAAEIQTIGGAPTLVAKIVQDKYNYQIATQQSQHWTTAAGTLLAYQAGAGALGRVMLPAMTGMPRVLSLPIPTYLEEIPPPT
jgi:hypothetical protein